MQTFFYEDSVHISKGSVQLHSKASHKIEYSQYSRFNSSTVAALSIYYSIYTSRSSRWSPERAVPEVRYLLEAKHSSQSPLQHKRQYSEKPNQFTQGHRARLDVWLLSVLSHHAPQKRLCEAALSISITQWPFPQARTARSCDSPPSTMINGLSVSYCVFTETPALHSLPFNNPYKY